MQRVRPICIGGIIAVDHFSKNPKIKYHFITHAHPSCYEDNYLDRQWTFYCSELTARILSIIPEKNKKTLIFDTAFLRPLALNVPHQFEEFTVTLLDANHVPGAVMFIFEGPLISDGPILYTGHFRADSIFYENVKTFSALQSRTFGLIYLDNTHVEADKIKFPSREGVVYQARSLIKRIPKNTKVYITSLPLTNFEVLKRISQLLKERIGLFPLSKKIADLLNPHNTFCDHTVNTRLQTVDRSQMVELLKEPATESSTFCVLELSVLVHDGDTAHLVPDDERIIFCDYSEQCSLSEIRDFLSQLKFNRILGIKKTLTLCQRNELRALMLPDSPRVDSTKEKVELKAVIADTDLEKIIATDTNKRKMVNAPAKYLLQEVVRKTGALPATEELVNPSHVVNFEKKLNLNRIANKVMEQLACSQQQKLFEAEVFSRRVNALAPDKRKDYEKACEEFTESSKDTHKPVLSFKITRDEFSDVFLEAYQDLKNK